MRSESEVRKKIDQYKEWESTDTAWTSRSYYDEYLWKRIALEWVLGIRSDI